MRNMNSRTGEMKNFYTHDAGRYDQDRYNSFLARSYVKASSSIIDNYKKNITTEGKIMLLDIATGTGRILRTVHPKNVYFIGVDACKEMIGVAKAASYNKNNISFVLSDALKLPLKDEFVDVVTCTRFVHLIDREALDKLLSEMARVTKKDGFIFIEGMNIYYKNIFTFRRLFRKTKDDLYLSPRSLRTIDDRLHFINFFGFGFPLVFRILSIFDEETTVKLMIFISKSPLKYILERWLAVWKKK